MMISTTLASATAGGGGGKQKMLSMALSAASSAARCSTSSVLSPTTMLPMMMMMKNTATTTTTRRNFAVVATATTARAVLASTMKAARAARAAGKIRKSVVRNRMTKKNKSFGAAAGSSGSRAASLSTSSNTDDFLPLSCEDMDNTTLVTLGELGDHPARTEILKRHISIVESESDGNSTPNNVNKIFQQIEIKNKEYMWLLALPYQIGITMAITGGMASIPLVFDHNTALWFNEHFVTTDIPEPQDLETVLEVGSWTWNWMEPPLGQISFFLITLQFARAQIQNLGIKPYTELIKQWRSKRLAHAFPKYNSRVVRNYSESAPIFHMD